MPHWDTPETPSKQIFEALREQIETEELPPGEKVPSVRALMETHGASSHTVQRAVRELREARLIVTTPNSGSVVRSRPTVVERSIIYTRAPAPGEPSRYGAKTELLHLGRVKVPAYIAELLDVERGADVVQRRRLLRNDGSPTEIVTSYYPLEVAEGTELASEKPLKGGSPGALERLGYVCSKTIEWVQGRLPLRSEVQLLEMPPSVPVLRLLRVVYADGDRPIEAIEMVMNAEGKLLRYDM